jgi:hypothetical protein
VTVGSVSCAGTESIPRGETARCFPGRHKCVFADAGWTSVFAPA